MLMIKRKGKLNPMAKFKGLAKYESRGFEHIFS